MPVDGAGAASAPVPPLVPADDDLVGFIASPELQAQMQALTQRAMAGLDSLVEAPRRRAACIHPGAGAAGSAAAARDAPAGWSSRGHAAVVGAAVRPAAPVRHAGHLRPRRISGGTCRSSYGEGRAGGDEVAGGGCEGGDAGHRPASTPAWRRTGGRRATAAWRPAGRATLRYGLVGRPAGRGRRRRAYLKAGLSESRPV